ncbi:UDP-N-acetylglucosamine transferase subunit ALG14 homolog [Galendromus occidentalis]|uniref:UDP-N-acetylglucosamine transferase subunit ALG14 n=1 Tax=Galendromus occidentalis TaxID=34638 RepID=A0AAJ6VYM6_9ACAR|nr:UDP-N-acetylglucosamine transferase subunit ALG14 homolog [Galendromus occidentalis]
MEPPSDVHEAPQTDGFAETPLFSGTEWLEWGSNAQYGLWLLVFLFLRVVITFMRLTNTKFKRNVKKPCKAMIVLGSGGHTSEMLRLIEGVSKLLYTPRIYVHADTDKLSSFKVTQAEGRRKDFCVRSISRLREVHQSLISVPITAIRPFLQAPWILLWDRPDVLLVNGPGTCIPLVLWSFIFGVLCLKRPVVVFVESFCRVETLSLTAKVVKPFIDRLIVQWRPLHEKYKKSTRYHGLLV